MISVILCLLLIIILHRLYTFFQNNFKSKQLNIKYNQKISEHLQKRDVQIAEIINLASSIPSDKKQLITQSTLSSLRDLFLSKAVTSREILLTFGERACTIGKDLNLIADISAFFPALESAEKADIFLASNPDSIPPLLGLPFSVKEQLLLKDSVTTCGSAAGLTKNGPSKTDALIIKVLKQSGAIPFVSSNVPQLLFSIDTVNNIYGQAKNPNNPQRITGGSSGGEAGLISSRCSPIGICSDAAGSIRMPSAFCGICGFKPTPRRISIKGRMGITLQEEALRENPPTIGPVGRCAEDLIMMMRCIFGGFQEDPQILPLKFQENELLKLAEGKKLKIGFIESNEFMESCSGVKNAIREICNILRKKHDVAEFECNIADQLMDCLIGLGGNQTAKAIEKTLDHEKPMPFSKRMLVLAKFPRFVKKILGFLMRFTKERRLRKLLEISNRNDPVAAANLKEELKNKFFDYWVKENFDVLITPVFPIPAPKLGENGRILNGLYHNLIGNLFEMPCGTIPVRKIKIEETLEYNDKYGDSITRFIQENLKGSEGLPIGINIYCKPFEDEKTLGVMRIFEEAAKLLIDL